MTRKDFLMSNFDRSKWCSLLEKSNVDRKTPDFCRNLPLLPGFLSFYEWTTCRRVMGQRGFLIKKSELLIFQIFVYLRTRVLLSMSWW